MIVLPQIFCLSPPQPPKKGSTKRQEKEDRLVGSYGCVDPEKDYA